MGAAGEVVPRCAPTAFVPKLERDGRWDSGLHYELDHLEFAGGAVLILGLLTPLVAALLALDMLVATVLVHLPAGFFAADGGYELTLTLFAASLALALTGPGTYALDTLVRRRRA